RGSADGPFRPELWPLKQRPAANCSGRASVLLLRDLVERRLLVGLPGRPAALDAVVRQQVQGEQRDRSEDDPEDPPGQRPPAELRRSLVGEDRAEDPEEAREEDEAGSGESGGVHGRMLRDGAAGVKGAGTKPESRPGKPMDADARLATLGGTRARDAKPGARRSRRRPAQDVQRSRP